MIKATFVRTSEIRRRTWLKSITLKRGVNFLFGGNGSGKTTVIDLIRSTANKSDFSLIKLGEGNVSITLNGKPFHGRIYSFSNSRNNMARRGDDHVFDLGMYGLARKYGSYRLSEGMNVSVSAYDFIYALDKSFEDGSIVLIDEIDSGLDVDSCRLLVDALYDAVGNREVYALASFNQFELVNEARKRHDANLTWINAYTGKRESVIPSYEEYREYLRAMKSTHRRKGDEEAWGEG